jgi:hypothetical protein
LAGYVVGFSYLALRPLGRTATQRGSGGLLFGGLGCFHLVFFAAYMSTLFLPIKMVSIIKP